MPDPTTSERSDSKSLRRWGARQFPFVLPLILLLLLWPWAFLGLLRFAKRPPWVRVIAALVWLAAVIWLMMIAPGPWWKLLIFVASVALVRLVWFSHGPKIDGNWVEEQRELPRVHFSDDGDQVRIENFRYTRYRTIDDFDVVFEDRSFDLTQVVGIDFLVVPFAPWRGLAHVLVSFEFADGEFLSVSVEARRETHEHYSPVGGLYRHYEVIYVIGDERDVVGKRAVFQNHPVYLYRMIAEPAAVRAIMESMFEKTNELADQPQFYHTVTNTCTSNVLVHATELENRPRRYDFRLVFPGYSDDLAYEVGLVDAPDGLEALRAAALINERAAAAPMDDGKAWSAAIRNTGN